jgi:hypothetical protein
MEALMPSADPQEGETQSLRVPTHVAESLARAAELAPGTSARRRLPLLRRALDPHPHMDYHFPDDSMHRNAPIANQS